MDSAMITMPGRLIVLWISGLDWAMARQMPVIPALQTPGATVRALEPLPITGAQTQAMQMLSGQNAGRTGFFDVWEPQRQHMPLADTGSYVRRIAEPDIWGMLRSTIAAAGRTMLSVDLALSEVPAYLAEAAPAVDLLIVHAIASDASGTSLADAVMVDRAVAAAQMAVGTDTVLFLLADYHVAPVKHYVNLNDALRDLEILEVTEQQTIRWDATLAYHAGHGQIWINLAGREPAGIVAARDEYDQVCQALVTALPAKIRDPQSGEPVIERIYRRTELYAGPYLFRAPDLVVVLRPDYAPSPRSIMAGFDGTSVWPAPAGTHMTAGRHPAAVAGLAIALGGPFVPGRCIARAALVDVVPTLLYTLGVPIPLNIDGEVITDLFAPAYRQQFPVQRAAPDPGLSAEDEAEILMRLKSLGYIG
jgi:hypothetical protein